MVSVYGLGYLALGVGGKRRSDPVKATVRNLIL